VHIRVERVNVNCTKTQGEASWKEFTSIMSQASASKVRLLKLRVMKRVMSGNFYGVFLNFLLYDTYFCEIKLNGLLLFES
jgi:hypothetical protein